MRTDKDYPATHSMSTAWFAVDVEGNVALMDYNENGPVPIGCDELDLEQLIFNLPVEIIDGMPTAIYSDEQLEDIVANLTEIKYNDHGWYRTIFEVKNEFIEKFIDQTKNHIYEDEVIVRLSKNSNLFLIDVYEDEIRNILEKVYNKGYITKFYNFDFWLNDDYNVDHTIKWEINFESLPYFIYGQPYHGGPMEKVNTPHNGVNVYQMPEHLRGCMTYIPLKFNETEKIQISECAPCFSRASEEVDENGDRYFILPDSTGMWTRTKQATENINPYKKLK